MPVPRSAPPEVQRSRTRPGSDAAATRGALAVAAGLPDLASDLRAALAAGEIQAWFQPIVRIDSAEVVGFEALARWERSGTSVPPDEFIPVAESSGLIDRLGLEMLDQACRFVAERFARTGEELMVSVNVASAQLDDPGFPAAVDLVVRRHEVPPRLVCLELTESALVANVADTVERLQALKALGLRLAIDDFGTGYSCLSYLTDFPVDILKLDRSLITGLPADGRRRVLAAAVIDLARALDISVLAEGVETEAERAVLVSLGCPFGQGYLWNRPMSADAARTLPRDACTPDEPCRHGNRGPKASSAGSADVGTAVRSKASPRCATNEARANQ